MGRNDKVPVDPGLPRAYEAPLEWLRALTSRMYSLLRVMIEQINVMIDGYLIVVASLPTADSQHRGRLVIVRGGVGVADEAYICRKNAADVYEWRLIT